MKQTEMKEITLSIEETDMLLGVLTSESVRLYDEAAAQLKRQNKEVTYENLRGNFFIEKRDRVRDIWLKVYDLQTALEDTQNKGEK